MVTGEGLQSSSLPPSPLPGRRSSLIQAPSPLIGSGSSCLLFYERQNFFRGITKVWEGGEYRVYKIRPLTFSLVQRKGGREPGGRWQGLPAGRGSGTGWLGARSPFMIDHYHQAWQGLLAVHQDQQQNHLHGDDVRQGEPHGGGPDAALPVGGQVDVHSGHHPKEAL